MPDAHVVKINEIRWNFMGRRSIAIWLPMACPDFSGVTHLHIRTLVTINRRDAKNAEVRREALSATPCSPCLCSEKKLTMFAQSKSLKLQARAFVPD